MATPFKVKAVFEYTSSHEDDLPFDIGQIITVTEVEDDDWYNGKYVDDSGTAHEGLFPRNFVEKYEPTAPPRPTRSRKKDNEPAPAAAAAAAAPPPPPAAAPEPEPAAEEEPEEEVQNETPVASPPMVATEPAPRAAPVAPVPKPTEPVPLVSPPPSLSKAAEPAPPVPAQPPAKAPAPARAGPPPVAEKPSSSSFKDRIAAFNKSAAPPIAPFKPSGLAAGGGTSSGFIKKPFVAPPPSRNAYVPPPRETPTAKVYRRDEDPEIKESQAETLESAERAGLVPATADEGQDEDQPKPTSLKERIALLQRQQAEQAQRHADAALKKEKPKRPTKKRTESEDAPDSAVVEEAVTPLERRDTGELAGRSSLDEAQPPRQPLPSRRKSSKEPDDGHEADMSGAGDTTEGQEDLTEKEDSDERPKPPVRVPSSLEPAEKREAEHEEEDDEEGEEEEEEEEDEDVDPEVKRKEELRARMAKMSGGMGMAGMFGGPSMMPMPGAPAPPKKKKSIPPVERKSVDIAEEEATSPRMSAPPIPTMMALPGMSQKKPPQEDEEEDLQTYEAEPASIPAASPRGAAPEIPSRAPAAPPPVPGGRPAPPPVPAEARPPPPPPPAAVVASPSVGSESDDELSEAPNQASLESSQIEAAVASRAPPPIPMASPPLPSSPRPTSAKRTSYLGGDEQSPISPQAPPNSGKRLSRPPPIPGAAPPPPTQNRPPPPPPPGAPSRSSTADNITTTPMQPGRLDNGEEGEVTEYEGDYDTDIGSSVPHKEALKSHARESSFEDNTPVRSPISEAPPSLPPPIPAAAPRAVPPPVPTQGPRASTEMPRAAPPPPPPTKAMPTYPQDDDEYDPYNYTTPSQGIPSPLSRSSTKRDDVVQPAEPGPSYQQTPSYESPMPPPPDRRGPPPAPPTNRAPPRQSMDQPRPSIGGRRSMDVARPSMESGFVANDVDLAPNSQWWLQPNGLPPVFQGRRDIASETEESTQTKRGGKSIVTKEVYILFQDYSQTVISATFDPQDPSDAQLEQRHESPPRALRQDQLEQAYEHFGQKIVTTVAGMKDTVVGDGTSPALVHELLKPFKDALMPVGTRAYGALVYANFANASTQLNDQIRPGDIITIRNGKFQGKHGPMHAKYSMEVGKPDHVAVVSEWDGTKKKVRAWEQGRENKKVKNESFKLDDLRSGEVKIWRIMPRSWIGWDSQH